MTAPSPGPLEFESVFVSPVARFNDEAYVIEMLSIFVVDGATAADRPMTAIMLSDAASIRDALHSLKNILGTMQSGSLFLLAEQTYEAFKSGNHALVHATAHELATGTMTLVRTAEIFLAELRKAVTP